MKTFRLVAPAVAAAALRAWLGLRWKSGEAAPTCRALPAPEAGPAPLAIGIPLSPSECVPPPEPSAEETWTDALDLNRRAAMGDPAARDRIRRACGDACAARRRTGLIALSALPADEAQAVRRRMAEGDPD